MSADDFKRYLDSHPEEREKYQRMMAPKQYQKPAKRPASGNLMSDEDFTVASSKLLELFPHGLSHQFEVFSRDDTPVDGLAILEACKDQLNLPEGPIPDMHCAILSLDNNDFALVAVIDSERGMALSRVMTDVQTCIKRLMLRRFKNSSLLNAGFLCLSVRDEFIKYTKEMYAKDGYSAYNLQTNRKVKYDPHTQEVATSLITSFPTKQKQQIPTYSMMSIGKLVNHQMLALPFPTTVRSKIRRQVSMGEDNLNTIDPDQLPSYFESNPNTPASTMACADGLSENECSLHGILEETEIHDSPPNGRYSWYEKRRE